MEGPDPDAAATAALVAADVWGADVLAADVFGADDVLADDVFAACLGFDAETVFGATTASGVGLTSVIGSGSVTTALGSSAGDSESTPDTGLEEMSPTSADTAGDCCVGVGAADVEAAAALWAALVAALGPYADEVVSGLWYLVVIRN